MADFSFLDDHPPLQRNNNRQQQQQQASGPPAAAAGGNAAAGATAGSTQQQQQQQQQQPRVRIQLPSFKQVQAAEAPSRPVSTFQPGSASSSQQQQQQQQQQQHQQQPQQQQVPVWLQQGPSQQQQQQQQPPSWQQQRQQQQQQSHPPGSAGINAPSGQAAAAATAAGQPSWLASLPSTTLHTQLPRFSQGAGGASIGAAVGISRPTVALPQASGGAPQHGQQQQQAAPAATAAAGAAGSAQQQQMALNAVLVSRRQQGNPMLKHIKAVRWVFADIVPDYLCGQNTAVLFLSLRYHLLQPEYVLSRLQALQRGYRLCVLLLLVDAEEVVKPLLELHRATLGAQAVLVCAWSNEECARYIETFKAYENKPASSIMKHTDTDYMGRLASALTTIRGVNRSDAYSLAKHFGSLADVFMCNDVEGFARIPGLGPMKAKRLLDTFNQPFRRSLAAAANTAAAAAAAAPGAAARAGGAAAAAGIGGTSSAAAAAGADPQQQQQQQQQATTAAGVAGSGSAAGSAAAGGAAAEREVQVEDGSDLELDWEAEVDADTDGGAGAGQEGGAAAGLGEEEEEGGQEEWDVEGWEGEQGEGQGTEELPGAVLGYHEDYLDVLEDGIDVEDF